MLLVSGKASRRFKRSKVKGASSQIHTRRHVMSTINCTLSDSNLTVQRSGPSHLLECIKYMHVCTVGDRRLL